LGFHGGPLAIVRKKEESWEEEGGKEREKDPPTYGSTYNQNKAFFYWIATIGRLAKPKIKKIRACLIQRI
jgi:hypothetical protein